MLIQCSGCVIHKTLDNEPCRCNSETCSFGRLNTFSLRNWLLQGWTRDIQKLCLPAFVFGTKIVQWTLYIHIRCVVNTRVLFWFNFSVLIKHIVTNDNPVCKHNNSIDYTYSLHIKYIKMAWSLALKPTWDLVLTLNI